MPKKTGLGKGLDALFGPTPEEEQVKEDDVLKNLKITEVEPNREQPRKNFNQEALEELADSIREYGLILTELIFSETLEISWLRLEKLEFNEPKFLPKNDIS